MKRLIYLFVATFLMLGTGAYAMDAFSAQENASRASVASSTEYIGELIVASIFRDDAAIVTVTNNGTTVDFDLPLSIPFIFDGNVHISGVQLNGTSVAGSTGKVMINGTEYTVTFTSGTIMPDACNIKATVQSTPVGDLSINFTSL